MSLYPIRAATIAALSALAALPACLDTQEQRSPAETDCERRLPVAKELAALHQYGGDTKAHIDALARNGASAQDIAAYREMAKKLKGFPTLAGDGGREMGIAMALNEFDLPCAKG